MVSGFYAFSLFITSPLRGLFSWAGPLCTCLTSISTCLFFSADSVLLIIIWANTNPLPERLFWRADSLGQRKSNIPLYLFNESDLLSSSYLLSDCPSTFLSPSVTLLRSVTSPHRLSLHLPFILIWSELAPDVSRWSPPTCPLSGLRGTAPLLYDKLS